MWSSFWGVESDLDSESESEGELLDSDEDDDLALLDFLLFLTCFFENAVVDRVFPSISKYFQVITLPFLENRKKTSHLSSLGSHYISAEKIRILLYVQLLVFFLNDTHIFVSIVFKIIRNLEYHSKTFKFKKLCGYNF